jgi:hypothetical protein
MHSFVENFLKYMFSDKMGLTDGGEKWFYNATILVGSGTTAENVTQTALISPITTLENGEISIDKTENVSDVVVTISRTFTNLTGSTITINEIGINARITDWTSGLHIRDLLDVAKNVADTESVTVSYDITIGQPFTRNLGRLLYYQAKVYNNSLYKTDGTIEYVDSDQYDYSIGDANEDDDDYGIIIGTDNTAIDITDYCLGARVTLAQGWLFSPVSAFIKTDAATGEVVGWISRYFTNNTGSSVTIEEVGLAGNANTNQFLFARYLTGSIAVADGETLQVVMKLKTTM